MREVIRTDTDKVEEFAIVLHSCQRHAYGKRNISSHRRGFRSVKKLVLIFLHKFLFLKVANKKTHASDSLFTKDYIKNERKLKHPTSLSGLFMVDGVYQNISHVFAEFIKNRKKSSPKSRGVLCQNNNNNNLKSNKFKRTFKILIPFSEVPP